MKWITAIIEACCRWIDAVAALVVDIASSVTAPRLVRLTEEESGEWGAQTDTCITDATLEPMRGGDPELSGAEVVRKRDLTGCRVELILRPERFLFRPLDLPAQAVEFLEGIVRAQIDRLTPWNATETVFGWSKPLESVADRIQVTVAITPRRLITSHLQKLRELGARSIAIFTQPENEADVSIKVLEEFGGTFQVARIRHVLAIVLIGALISAVGAVGTSMLMGVYLEAQQEEVAQQIKSARAATGSGSESWSLSAAALEHTLERRKFQTPPIVLVLETLSRILPDDTYVTELAVDATKLRLVGRTRESPALISLLERSGRFTRATFFAPTTRTPSESTEQFHIEAQIQPIVTAQR